MNRFEEGQLKKIADVARESVESNLSQATPDEKLTFVQVECTKVIVEAIQSLDIQGAKEEVIAEVRKIPKPNRPKRNMERGGWMALGGVIGGAVAEFVSRFRGG